MRRTSLGNSLLFSSRQPKSSSQLGIISRSPLAHLLLTSKPKTLNTSPYDRSAGRKTEDRCLYEWLNAVAQQQQVWAQGFLRKALSGGAPFAPAGWLWCFSCFFAGSGAQKAQNKRSFCRKSART